MPNKIITTAKHPRDGTDIVIYEETWTNHALLHEELKSCGESDCLNEVVETLNNPDVIRKGRTQNTELFVRHTIREDFETFKGFSVATKKNGNITLMTTAYFDVIKHSKGKVIWKKGDSDE